VVLQLSDLQDRAVCVVDAQVELLLRGVVSDELACRPPARGQFYLAQAGHYRFAATPGRPHVAAGAPP